jgi:hypothetical protein
MPMKITPTEAFKYGVNLQKSVVITSHVEEVSYETMRVALDAIAKYQLANDYFHQTNEVFEQNYSTKEVEENGESNPIIVNLREASKVLAQTKQVLRELSNTLSITFLYE